MGRFTQFAIAASLEAMGNARLKIDSSNGYEVGMIIGTGIEGLATLSRQFLLPMINGKTDSLSLKTNPRGIVCR
jgi:3-oxoacyl-(acyl-carrier-protein) synthase